jgi:hypothetical protein
MDSFRKLSPRFVQWAWGVKVKFPKTVHVWEVITFDLMDGFG